MPIYSGGLQHIKKGEFLRLKLPYPEYDEQVAIASALRQLDDQIRVMELLLLKHTRIRSGLMQDLLTRGIDSQGRIRSERTHEFKDSPLGRIPVEWHAEVLEKMCSRIQDGTHFSPVSTEWGEFLYVTSKNIRSGYLDISDCGYIDANQHAKIFQQCPVAKGDVLLTKDGANTGNAAINPLDEQISLLSSIAVLRCNDENYNRYLLYYILSESGQRMIKSAMSGLAIRRITLSVIKRLRVPRPDRPEQVRIANMLASADAVIEQSVQQLSKLRRIKRGLMQDLLTGKVRVPEDIKKQLASTEVQK